MGFIYVITEEFMQKHNKYKIGFTTREKNKLIADYVRPYGRPILVRWIECGEKAKQYEKEIHTILNNCKYPGRGRELFVCDIKLINNVIKKVIPFEDILCDEFKGLKISTNSNSCLIM